MSEKWYEEVIINGLRHEKHLATGQISLTEDYKVSPPLPQICYNHYCHKVLGEEDHSAMFGTKRDGVFPSWWLCSECFSKFDGQKMRGRFAMIGYSHNQSVGVLAAIERDCGKELFNLGRPEDESRYTESVSQWIEWQKPG